MEKVISLDLSKCTNILYSDSPSYSGIIVGECKGDVWVDNIENPTLALVYSFPVGGFSIMGNCDDSSVYDDFLEFLKGDLFSELKSKGINDFEFSVENKRLEDCILKHFSDRSINQEDEYFYRKYDTDGIQEMDSYNIIRVDSAFIRELQAGEYDNQEFLSKRILESWGDYGNFLEKSIAYAATYEKSIVGVIVGTSRYQNIMPIDIEVKVDHRKKGLAYSLTKYFVNECVDRSIVAQWNCVDSNIGSRKTVEKAGFKLMKKKQYYWFDI